MTENAQQQLVSALRERGKLDWRDGHANRVWVDAAEPLAAVDSREATLVRVVILRPASAPRLTGAVMRGGMALTKGMAEVCEDGTLRSCDELEAGAYALPALFDDALQIVERGLAEIRSALAEDRAFQSGHGEMVLTAGQSARPQLRVLDGQPPSPATTPSAPRFRR